MSFEAGTLFYAVDADTSGLLRAEREVGQSTQRMEGSFGKSVKATDDQGKALSKLNPISRGVKRGNEELTGSVEKMGEGFNKARALAAGLAALLAGLATGAIVNFVRSSLDAIDAQAKLARQLDATMGGLRGLQLAANDAGVATGTINSAVERMNMTLGQAERGAGSAGEALQRLGLDVQTIIGMDADERMAAIADRVQALGLNGAQTADVLRQLGIRQREIVNLMREGGDPIRAATQEIRDYGLAIDDVDAAAIEAANDALSRVGLVVESVRQSVAYELSPIILELANRFNSAAREAGGWGQVTSNAIERSAMFIGRLLDALQSVDVAIQVAGVSTRMFALEVATSMADATRAILAGPVRAINGLVEQINRIPGLDVGAVDQPDFVIGMESAVERLRAGVSGAQSELDELAAKELPSERIERFFDDARARADELMESAGGAGGALVEFADSNEQAASSSRRASESANDQSDAYNRLLDQLFPLQAAQAEYKRNQGLLAVALMEGRLTTDQYTEALERLEEQARNTGDVWDSYDLFRGDAEGGESGYWADWLSSAETAFGDFDRMTADLADTFTRQTGDMFADVLMNQQSFSDGFQSMMQGLARQVVAAIGQMIAQWLAYQAVTSSISLFGGGAGGLLGGFAGMFDKGGKVPSGQWGIAGENGPEIIRGPAEVISTQESAKIIGNSASSYQPSAPRDSSSGLPQPAPVNINVTNSTSSEVDIKERTNDDGSRDIDVFVADIMGDGPRSKAIRSKFGLKPRGR